VERVLRERKRPERPMGDGGEVAAATMT
jgi:hypothetical protein